MSMTKPPALLGDHARTLAVLASAALLGGCNGALIGNMVVLAVTVGIFFGTLGLGRVKASSATQSAERSQAGQLQQPRR